MQTYFAGQVPLFGFITKVETFRKKSIVCYLTFTFQGQILRSIENLFESFKKKRKIRKVSLGRARKFMSVLTLYSFCFPECFPTKQILTDASFSFLKVNHLCSFDNQ